MQPPWNPELPEVIQAVETHRQYWKPDRVRVLLLAESHVYTSEDDFRATHLGHHIPDPNYPEPFVRLVYSLGYGENDLLKEKEKVIKNTGTWQFWRIFYSCLNPINHNSDFDTLKKTKTPLQERIQTKYQLLKQLKENGIWLLDVSPIGLYNIPDSQRPPQRIVQQIIWQSWLNYAKPIIEKEQPSYIICIGKGVWNIIGKDLQQMFPERCECIPQPQARLSAVELLKTYQRYYQICSQTI